MSSETTTSAPAYRGDVQGMRALAVLAVMASHAGIPGVGGGFVGVDVFFVVSGYLITRLLCTGIASGTGFSLLDFYARRARRILPAAALVLAVTVGASLVYLNFLDAADAARDAVWAALFAANLRFLEQGVDYFAMEAAPSPLQHYWSLAVEEQFYLVWPLLIGLALLLTRRRRADGRVPVRSLTALAVLIVASSLAWSLVRTEAEPTAAYFSTLTRTWELGVGALLAILVQAGLRVRWRWLREPLALGGLVAIGVAITRFDLGMAFPGYHALLPVLGAAALILAGVTATERDAPGAGPNRGGGDDPEARPPAASLVAALLSTAPMRRIGDWSYSLYLWHWPLIVIPSQNLGRDLTPTETAIAIALTFQLGALTYRFVEQPFRTAGFWRRRGYRGLLLYPASLALVLPSAFGGYAWATYLGGERGDDPAVTAEAFGVNGEQVTALVQASVEAARKGWPIPSDLTPDLLDLSDDVADVGECNYQRPERPLCRRGDPTSDKVIVVTGDSHARAWIPAFEQIAREAGYAAYYLVKQQCTAAFVDPGRLGTGERWPECEEFHGWVVDQVRALRPDLLVVATSPPPTGVWDPDTGELVTARDDLAAELQGGYDDMFAAYEPLAQKVMLLADVPRLPEEPGACLAARGAHLGDCLFTPTDWSEQMRQVSLEAADRARVRTIDPTPWLCFQDQCPVVIGSSIAWRDRGHISATRAGELWRPLGIALKLLDDPTRDDRRDDEPTEPTESTEPEVPDPSPSGVPEPSPTVVGPPTA
ncbi:acyltransferase family protein [Nocardioides sp.]|uniref:acyltransferase family protein n=1 Tax=Nocardioides sp. TaxID=35761 RepID=UPI003518A388